MLPGDLIELLVIRMIKLALYFSLMLFGTMLRPMQASDLFPVFTLITCENWSVVVLIASLGGAFLWKLAAVFARLVS